MIITIDGPAGSGKSTTAKNLAKALGISFLDTGATYRAVTYCALEKGIDMTDEAALVNIAKHIDLKFIENDSNLQVLCSGKDISNEIRTEAVSRNAKYVATPAAIREILVSLQRKMGAQLGSFVAEGRDQGTVVFPDADFKFYAETPADIRAHRRVAQLEQAGQATNYDQVLADIIARDKSDESREVGPLRKPADAHVINTGKLNPQQVVQAMLDIITKQK